MECGPVPCVLVYIPPFHATMSESFAWMYFSKNVKEEVAVCNKCKIPIKCRGWSTSGLIRHLKNKHGIDKSVVVPVTAKRPAVDDGVSSSSGKKNTVQQKLSFFIRKDTREELVTKLAAVDGFSINAITKSVFIRQSFTDKGLVLPKSPSDVMGLIHTQYCIVKDRIYSEIHSRVSAGSRFSLSLDEYTSLNNRRYLNINVHKSGGSFWNLGMVKIDGAMPAEKAVEAVQNKLSEFSLDLEKHVVACVTDGASVMVKFGRIIDCDHQLCYAHGIHLAVCDVLYRKTDTVVEAPAAVGENVTEVEDCDEFGDEGDLSTPLELVTDDLETVSFEINTSFDSRDGVDKVNVSAAINKIRQIARLFRKSPLKNEILQSYVQKEHGKSLMIILDSKTRWNSLLAMLERFLEIWLSVAKALIDCKSELNITKEELAAIQDIVSSLQPVKAGAEKLTNRETTILAAEGVFGFILGELAAQKTPFAKVLRESLLVRIKERRNNKLVGLMKYLHCGKKYNNHVEKNLPALPAKSSLIQPAKKMLSRLFDVAEDESSSSQSEPEDELLLSTSNQSLAQKLEAAIKTVQTDKVTPVKENKGQHLAKEFDVFESTGQRTTNITLLLDALKTVPPTSVESERAFSAAGLFVTKLRTRLSDRSVDRLCLLKSYYNSQ